MVQRQFYQQQNQMQQLGLYFSREEITHMNPEEVEYAKGQLHRLLTQQLSKVSIGLSKREKFESNLEQLRFKEKQETNQKIERLSKKFQHTQEKRKRVLQKRIVLCKLHDKMLEQRIAQINRRRIQEEREAAKKSRTYSVDLLRYMRQKELQQSRIQQRIKRQFMSKSKIPAVQVENNNTNNVPVERQRTLSIVRNSTRLISPTALDESVRLHQRRARMKEEQMISHTFQKILKKMDMMNQRRLKILKDREKKKSISSFQKMQRSFHTYDGGQQKQQKQGRSLPRPSRSPDLKKTIDYLSIKRQKQQRQFQQRGQVYAKMKQKSRKDDILRHLRGKVREYGMTLLNQTK